MEQALATLMLEGRSESDAVRTALVELGSGVPGARHSPKKLEGLADGSVDSAERRAVMAEMDAVAADRLA